MDELGFEEAADFLGGEAVIAQVFYDVADASLCLEELGRTRLRTAWRGDVSAGAVAELKEALMLKLHVGFGDGVVADDEFLGKGADAGHQIAVLQDAGLDSVTDLLDQL
ncbi:MAG TPA: hypothetical protein VIJ53_18020 [Acidobacteriaceae bacterium]